MGRHRREDYNEVQLLMAETGLSQASIYYRRRVGLPMDAPRGGLYNRGVYDRKNDKYGRPVSCIIANTEGRPEICFSCTKYVTCLNFASDRNWRGWKIAKEGIWEHQQILLENI